MTLKVEQRRIYLTVLNLKTIGAASCTLALIKAS
jgi:hypothetical protein